MILTNERVDAATALRIGLVEEVVPRGKALDSALAMAERACAVSPRAAAYSKQLVHLSRQGVPRQAALALERERFVDLFDGEDQREGVNAFLQKRAPQWRNA
jgi:enoyl-CoA hydratase/carnithine racemase